MGESFPVAYSWCDIFTSEKLGYLLMDMSTYRKESLESMIKHMPDATYSFREMLLLDSIVLNYDRHMGNYGFMVDNDTFRIVRIAPIFDFDHCLGDYISLQSNSRIHHVL